MSTLFTTHKSILEFYRSARSAVEVAGFSWEIEWQEQRLEVAFSESDLLREAAWVILCSGFREAAVNKIFDYVSLCFCDWESAEIISQCRKACVETALVGFRNKKKISAIADVADIVNEVGFLSMRQKILAKPIQALSEFPYIGPITSWHLAKNLGLDVAKHDRHLAKLANYYAYSDAHELCNDLSSITGEHVAVIDIVLWRFLSITPRALIAA